MHHLNISVYCNPFWCVVWCFCWHRNFISYPLSKCVYMYIIQLNLFLCSAAQLPKAKGNCYHFLSIARIPTPSSSSHTAMNSLSISNYIKDVWPNAAYDVRLVIVRCFTHPLIHPLIYNAVLSRRNVTQTKGKCWRQTTSNAFCSTRISLRARWETVSSSTFPLHTPSNQPDARNFSTTTTTKMMAADAEARATLQLRTTQIFHIPIAFDTTISPARTPNIQLNSASIRLNLFTYCTPSKLNPCVRFE